MKGQVMADFVLEYSRRPNQHHESSKQEWWTLRVDGASRSSGSGVGLLLQSPTGEHLEQAIRLGFSASNNEAEYEAILSGLDLALALSVSKLRIYSDSQLVQFTEWTIEKIKRADNRRADALAGIAASLPIKEAFYCLYMCKPTLLSQKFPLATPLRQPSKRPRMDGQYCRISPDRHSTRRSKQAHKIRVQAARFTLIGGHLYKRSFTGPYLRCLGHSEAQYVLAELHEGICGNHSGGRSLAHRAHSQGYYWPTMKKMRSLCQKCDKCQRYAPIPHMPSATLNQSQAHGLAQWGMDSGTLPAAPAQRNFPCATDYFSKWVEAEAYASIKDKDVTNIAFRNFCSELNIRNSYSTPRYPQSLNKPKGKWVEELPGVLWAYRTTPGRPTGNTPFALAYGMDAVIPTEIGLPTIRTDAAKQNDANTELGRNLDWADEVRRAQPSGWQTINKEHPPITIAK
ncbi:hypothetical protein CK203_058068 [Vitis vinifera]|uniref:Uncharacterized protein n=1 Tax=Vitis vinifera TaxID=29760 RepID=A0A438GEW8_VITVI|nr:hypothetical protein CK203_058068 [Vitis vinifera]